MTGIYDGSEAKVDPYYNLQDGSGEQQPSAVYVNQQDGNGEVKVWPTYLEDWNDGTTGWANTGGNSIGTQSASPVSAATYAPSDPPSDVYGYCYGTSGDYTEAENTNLTPGPGGTYELFLRSGAGGAGGSETQLHFACQTSNNPDSGGRYRFTIYNGQDQANLYKHSGGTETTLFTSSGITVDSTEWSQVQIQWGTDGYIEIRMKNIGTDEGPWTIGSTTDTTFSSGHIRIGSYHGSNTHRTDMDGLREISGFTI